MFWATKNSLVSSVRQWIVSLLVKIRIWARVSLEEAKVGRFFMKDQALFVIAVEEKQWQESLDRLSEIPIEYLAEKDKKTLLLSLLKLRVNAQLFDLLVPSSVFKKSFEELVKEVGEGKG